VRAIVLPLNDGESESVNERLGVNGIDTRLTLREDVLIPLRAWALGIGISMNHAPCVHAREFPVPSRGDLE
jgi:hypothetical protein